MQDLLTQVSCLGVALSARDSYTQDHANRVEILSNKLGIKCGLSSHELQLLRGAATLHDIGKIGIPDRILLKTGHFEADEWEVMKTHSELGQRICASIAHDDAEEISFVVRHHHESFDGSGYPDGLSGENIPISSRIISIVDTYDAMTTTRPYHFAQTNHQVLETLENDSGKKIDPILNKYFQSIIGNGQFNLAS